MQINVNELNQFIWRESFACKYVETKGVYEHTKESCPKCNPSLLRKIAEEFIQAQSQPLG